MKKNTRLIHAKAGRGQIHTVNPAIERGSTVLLPTREELYGDGKVYGRMGLTVQRELELAMCELENAKYTRLTSNGLQACALAIAAVAKSGDHILIADGIYGPYGRFCQRRLARMGVTTTRFATLASPQEIEALIRPETKAIILESPASLTFDIMDVPAIVELASAKGIITVFDNTYGAGLFHKPLDLGIDISVQALTKYPVGHADALGGAVMTNSDTLAAQIAHCAEDWGISLAPDDAYLAIRGLRTLQTRLKQHEASGYKVAEWLAGRDEVANVLHPGRPDHPEHARWKRDFSGANGLFGVILNETSDDALDAFLEAMKLFGMGFSWGGYESLLIPCCEQVKRLKTDRIHNRAGPLLRLHIGLEDPSDLIDDLEQSFEIMARSA